MPILGNCKKLLKSTEITQKLSIKICFWEDNVLILWLKGLRSGGIELQPCLSRYILRAVYCFFSTQPHRAVARKQLLKRCYFHLIFRSETWPLNCDVKMVDSSTYIVGIIMLHGSGASMLYRCGADVLSTSQVCQDLTLR